MGTKTEQSAGRGPGPASHQSEATSVLVDKLRRVLTHGERPSVDPLVPG